MIIAQENSSQFSFDIFQMEGLILLITRMKQQIKAHFEKVLLNIGIHGIMLLFADFIYRKQAKILILVIIYIPGLLEHNMFLLGFCEQGGPQVNLNNFFIGMFRSFILPVHVGFFTF